MVLAVNAVNPALSKVTGGVRVRITGTDFAASVRVKFGDNKATNITRHNATTIDATVPSQTLAGPVAVTVTNDPGMFVDGGPTAAWGAQFEYYSAIESIEPATLPTAGGAITIEGKGFPVGARVVARTGGGDIQALAVNRVSATRITCTVQQHALGVAQICVLNPAPNNTAYGSGIHICAPVIDTVSPFKGRLAGATQVTITGEHFVATSTVHFDGAPAAGPVVFNSSTELQATTAPHVAGRVGVTVTNPQCPVIGGPTPAPAVPAAPTTVATAFEFGDAEVLSIEPDKGPEGGGTAVTIKGRGFLALAVNGVQIGGVATNPTNRVDAMTITATTQPAAAGPGNISVTNNLGDAAAVRPGGFTFVARPTVTAVDPAEGPEGTQVTVQGTAFEKGAAVRFGGQAATNVQVISATAIRCQTPAHANGAVDVDVQNDAGDARTLNAGFTYTDFRIEPKRGLPAGGDNITIHIPALPPPPATVTIGGLVAAPVGGGAFVVTTAAHAAGPVDVVVDGETLVGGFEYSPITRIEPDAGPAGTTVQIHGTGFDGSTAVSMGGVPTAAPPVVVSPTQITVISPAHAPGAVDVVVTHAGAGTFTNGYTYQVAATLTGIEPAMGTNAGGTEITVTGTHFVEDATVSIGGQPAGNVVVVSPTTITATTPPAGGAGPYAAVAVSMLNPGAAAPVAGGNLWTYRNAPTVTAVADPAQGSDAGGRGITVTGTDFLAEATVHVGGTEATDVEVVNANTLRCRVPAHAAGAVPIAVQNPGDPTPGPPRAASFTYIADPFTATGHNHVQFLLDGERFFHFMQQGFETVRQAPPDPDGLTYVRLAYWNAHDNVTLGARANFRHPSHTLLKYVEKVASAGHHVEIILWRPNGTENKFGMGKGVYASNRVMADKLYAIDVAMAEVPGSGRVRVYFEHSEGETGASLHQKIAIFSIGGIRHAIVGGLNLSLSYFGSHDHTFPALGARCRPWHDAAIYVRGPITDDIEAEWMRRWHRLRALEAAGYGYSNLYGHAGEFLARDFSFFEWATVRRRAIETEQNTTHQPAQVQNTSVTIATTRSVGTNYHTNIRDKIIERINAANNYIYFENYHFCDPDLVQAIVARHAARAAAGADLRVAIVVPHPMGPDSSFITRRAWLHFALTFMDGTTAPATPYCTRVVYDIGGGQQTVLRAACGANWNVVDCYNPGAPTATNWLENDTLTFDAGAGPVTVPFHQIVAVQASIHFYCPKYVHAGPTINTVYTHSKIAAFDGQWLVVGSANWSFRSMQYDAEISAFIDSAAITGPTITALLGHFNTGAAAPTPLNVEGVAVGNAGAPGVGQIRLYPYEYYNPGAAMGPHNPLFPFSREIPPAGLTALAASKPPRYTWI